MIGKRRQPHHYFVILQKKKLAMSLTLSVADMIPQKLHTKSYISSQGPIKVTALGQSSHEFDNVSNNH